MSISPLSNASSRGCGSSMIAISTRGTSGSLRPVRPFAIGASSGADGAGYRTSRHAGFDSSTMRCERRHSASRYGPVPTGCSATRFDASR